MLQVTFIAAFIKFYYIADGLTAQIKHVGYVVLLFTVITDTNFVLFCRVNIKTQSFPY